MTCCFLARLTCSASEPPGSGDAGTRGTLPQAWDAGLGGARARRVVMARRDLTGSACSPVVPATTDRMAN